MLQQHHSTTMTISNQIKHALCLALLLLSLLIAGCVTGPAEKCLSPDEKEIALWDYGRYEYHSTKWWHPYMVGLAYIQCEDYQNAEHYLKLSINKTLRYSDKLRANKHYIDKWRHRTENSKYTNFDYPTFNGYFPRRELGIIYYNARNYEKSLQKLIESINQSPTERAATYLIKAAEKWLVKNPVKRLLPVLGEIKVINARKFKNIHYVNSNRPFIDIEIKNPLLIKSVTVNNQNCRYQFKERLVYFEEMLADSISVLLSKDSRDIGEPAEPVHVRTYLSLKPQGNVYSVQLTDLKGNKTEPLKLQIVYDVKGPSTDCYLASAQTRDGKILVGISARDGSYLYSQRFLPDNSKGIIGVNRKEIQNREIWVKEESTIIFEDLAGNRSEIHVKDLQVRSKSPLKLDNEKNYTYEKQYHLSGTLTVPWDFLKVNNVTIFERIEKVPYRFSLSLALKQGKNAFEFSGRLSTGEVIGPFTEYIYCKHQDIYGPKARLKILLAREIRGDNLRIPEELYEEFSRILRYNGRFDIIYEEKDAGYKKDKLIKMAQQHNAEAVMIATITYAHGTISTRASLFDRKNRYILNTNTFNEQTPENIGDIAKRLEWKIQQEYPLLQGNVSDKKGVLYTINRGIQDGLLAEMKLMFFSELFDKEEESLQKGKVKTMEKSAAIAEAVEPSHLITAIKSFITR